MHSNVFSGLQLVWIIEVALYYITQYIYRLDSLQACWGFYTIVLRYCGYAYFLGSQLRSWLLYFSLPVLHGILQEPLATSIILLLEYTFWWQMQFHVPISPMLKYSLKIFTEKCPHFMVGCAIYVYCFWMLWWTDVFWNYRIKFEHYESSPSAAYWPVC